MTGIKLIKQNKGLARRAMAEGFTLVEMVVVMAIFLLVIGSGISIFISIIQHQAAILAEQKILNQLSYAEEHMSKALRMAKRSVVSTTDVNCVPADYTLLLTRKYESGSVGAGYYNGIKFISQTDGNMCTEFFLDTDGVLKEIKGTSSAAPLTSTDVKINYIRFAINGVIATNSSGLTGATKGQILQPRLTISMSVKIKGATQDIDRVIQTTISARNLNVQ
jgi:prepilin-type N-terminal cleavage/methylation domain-containing protein